MKKLLKIIYFLLLPFYSALGLGQIGLSIHDTTLVAGDVINIPVYVDSSLTGENVSSYNLQFDFNSYYLQVDSAFSTGTLTEGWGAVSYNTSVAGKISVAAAGSTDLFGTGILLFLRVKAIRSGGTYLSFTDTTYNYLNEGTPRVILNNGYISVTAKPTISVYPDTEILAVGDTKQFTVSYGTTPYAWSVTNSTVASIDENGLLTALSKGTTHVVAQDANGVIDTSGVIEVRAFRLSTRDTAFYKGQEIDIPIYTSDLTGLNYTSGEFTIELDGNILTPTEIITTETLLSGYSTPAFSFRDNKLKIAFAGNAPLAGSGVLLKVKFQITSGSGSGTYLTFSDVLFNETDIGDVVRSYFTAWNLATLAISPNTGSLLVGDTLRFSASNGTPPYTWSVSNPSLATVDNSGLLTALSGGVVTLSVQDAFGGFGTSGNINLYDTEVWIPDTTAEINNVIELPIYMGNLSSSHSIVSLQTNVLFDSSKIKFDQIVTTGTSTNGWSFSVNNQGNKIIIAAASTTGFNSAGTIVKLRFNVSSRVSIGNYSNVTLENFLFNEGTPNALITNGRVTIVSTTPPNAPTGLVTVVMGTSQINLMWQDNSNTETGFTIERSVDTAGAWTQIADLSANTTSYMNTGLIDGTEYFYRVYAYNANGNSTFSNIDSAVTTMNAPTDLVATNPQNNRVVLTWSDNSSSEDGYIIERHDGPSTGSSMIFVVIDTVSENVATYTDSNFTSEVDYVYIVRGYNSKITSSYSNEAGVTLVGVNDEEGLPTKFELFQNYPNPFNPSTMIKFTLPEESEVKIDIYNLLGEKVATLMNNQISAGYHEIAWNAGNVPSGIYLISIRFKSNRNNKVYSFTKKAMLLK